jgi:hypothetical protein
VNYGIYALTFPFLQPQYWNFITFDKVAVEYTGGIFRWLGLISIGMGILTASISITSSRRGEKWAWSIIGLSKLLFPFRGVFNGQRSS